MNIDKYLLKIDKEVGTIKAFSGTSWGKKITEMIHGFKNELMDRVEAASKFVANDEIIINYCEDYYTAVKLYTQIISLSDLKDFGPIEIERRGAISILADMIVRTMDAIRDCKMNTSKSKFTRIRNKIEMISKRYLGVIDERTIVEYMVELKHLALDVVSIIKDAYISECNLSSIECIRLTNLKMYDAYTSATKYFESFKAKNAVAPARTMFNSVLYEKYGQKFQTMIANSAIELSDLYLSISDLSEYRSAMENHMELLIAIHQLLSIETEVAKDDNQSGAVYTINMNYAFDFTGVYVLKKMCSMIYDIADAACKTASSKNQRYIDAMYYINGFAAFGADLEMGANTYLSKLKKHIEVVISTIYANWNKVIPDYMQPEVNKLQMIAAELKRNTGILCIWLKRIIIWMDRNCENGIPFELSLDSAEFSVVTDRFDALSRNIYNGYVKEKDLDDVMRYIGQKFNMLLSTIMRCAPDVYFGIIREREALELIYTQTKYAGTEISVCSEEATPQIQRSISESLSQISIVGDICSVISSKMILSDDELTFLKESGVLDNVSKIPRTPSTYGTHIWEKFDSAVGECRDQFEEEKKVTEAMKFFGIFQ